jgi:tetratricopeptide (TPR) repeat protein
MRARLGLAETLDRMDDFDGAAGHYEELLRLNPNDNQGVRDNLAVLLLRLEAWDRLQALFDRYPDDWVAEPLYVRALYAFKRAGDGPESRRALDKALETNPHVPSYLLGEREFPEDLPDSYAPGDEDEAAVCADMLLAAWEDAPGALDWLKRRRAER